MCSLIDSRENSHIQGVRVPSSNFEIKQVSFHQHNRVTIYFSCFHGYNHAGLMKQLAMTQNLRYIKLVFYHSQHALVFSDGTTTSEESDDHNKSSDNNEDVGTSVEKVKVVRIVDIFAEVLIHTDIYTQTHNGTS